MSEWTQGQVMQAIEQLVAAATAVRAAEAEKKRAFGTIVQRYQDVAFACAYAVLGDFHAAEDAAQEAFIVAWRCLDQLRDARAFPGWLKRIVLTQCSRMTRGRRLASVPLDSAFDLAIDSPGPEALAVQHEQREQVQAAIAALPEHERFATLMFYIGDYSQQEIAAFLEIPVGTVKKRLFSARNRLRETMSERMIDMVRDTLQEQKPSRSEQFADTVALFNAALDSFVARVRQDRYIIAGVLFGSLSHDTVWRKSDIDLILVVRDEQPSRDFCLIEHGVNIHAYVMPRSKFKQAVEGSLQGASFHSMFALSTLLFTTDDTIRAYYDNIRKIGARDRQLRLMAAGGEVLYTHAKAEKWLVTRGDTAYSFLWLMYTVQSVARIEVLAHDEITGREVLPQALKLNPALFKEIYIDLINGPKDAATIRRVIDLIASYIDERTEMLFGPILTFLNEAGSVRTTSEIDAYFKDQVQIDSLSNIYEWLADKGIIHKVPSPVRLTRKSQVMLDEAAYYYDGARAER
jgi:RNA polymerase sigma factor (sigma-70 family)